MAMMLSTFAEQERKRNGYCRYFARGDCRSGKDCKFSHDPKDIPVCRYYMEDRCHFGADCWYRHPEEQVGNMFDMSPIAAIIGSSIMCSINPNVNLLLAAAIAGAPTPGQTDKEQDSDDEKEKEEITLEKALEMWKCFGEKTDKNNNKDSTSDPENDEEDLTDGYDVVSDNLVEFSDVLQEYTFKSWSPEDIYTLITTLITSDIKEYDEYDFVTSKVIGTALRLWKADSQAVATLFMMFVEKKNVNLIALILTVCNSPNRVHSLEKHIAFTMLEAERKDPTKWGSKAVGELFHQIEENGFNVDAIEFFNHMGKEMKDAEKLGSLVNDYLVATGDKDSFECRCKTAECECPIVADEGVAFIMFAGLQRKLEWNDEDKVKFFKKATDSLWKPEVLAELGETFGVKEPLAIATPRKTITNINKPQAKDMKKPGDDNNPDSKATRKCQGKSCTNQNKKDCDNMMCGRCCKKSGKTCSVHEDPLDIYVPPEYKSSHHFRVLEPSVFFANRQKMEEILTAKSNEQIRRVNFDGEFSVMDQDLMRVVNCWGASLVVLTLGSTDSGCGYLLTDLSAIHLANNCPKLRRLVLESATNITDKGMCELIDKCKNLEELEITGNDKISGKLTDASLKKLFGDDMLPNLQQVCVNDQHAITHEVVLRLRRRRPNLRVLAEEDDFDDMMMMSLMGMDYGFGYEDFI